MTSGRHLTISLCVAIICTSAVAKTFESQQGATKEHVVACVAEALHDSDIVVTYPYTGSRFVRNTDFSLKQPFDLGLEQHWLLYSLKYKRSITPLSLLYLYSPTNSLLAKESPDGKLRYTVIHSDEARSRYTPGLRLQGMTLLLMRQRTMPSMRHAMEFAFRVRTDPEKEKFFLDIRTMTESQFLEQYGPKEVFEKRVFEVGNGCVFGVDYPMPELPEPTPEQLGPNQTSYELQKKRLEQIVRDYNTLIHLSPREVSEVVFTAYWLEGADEGAAKYAEACAANPAILLPLTAPADFETEIGKRLFEAVKAKTYGEASP